MPTDLPFERSQLDLEAHVRHLVDEIERGDDDDRAEAAEMPAAVEDGVGPRSVERAVRDILMEIALLSKPKSGVKSQIFFINLKKFGTGANARWLVDNWVPRGSAPVPDGTFRGGS